MTLPTLYSRTATGAIQTWTIETEGDKYRTVFGQKNGAIQTTNWTICYPTNEGRANARNSEEQAVFEAKALWKKKKESGCFEDIKDIDTALFTEPMLAKKYEDYVADLTMQYPVYCQPKLDGLRCVARKDGLYSRNGKKYFSVPHIEEALKSFFEQYPNVILDGELYCDKFANDFNAICSLVKKTKPSKVDLEASAKSIQYWVYDNVDTTKTFKERNNWLYDTFPKHDSLKWVPTYKCLTSHALDSYYEEFIQQGYEGQMVRVDKPYENKRSKNLLKRKEFQDREYVIVDVVEGEGNKQNMLGAFTLKNDNGLTFNSNVKGTREYLQELWSEKEKLIGKLATVQYFNLTPVNADGTGGVPRFPYVIRIREDFDV